MTTANDVVERAMELGAAGIDEEEAVRALLDCCAGRRVSVVLARRTLEERGTEDEAAARALQLVESALAQLPE